MRPYFNSLFVSNYQKEFTRKCKIIESNPNYQPYITDEELLSFVRKKESPDKKVTALTTRQAFVTAIQPYDSSLLPETIKNIGAFYTVKIAKYGKVGLTPIPLDPYYINNSLMILVKKDLMVASYYLRELLEGELNPLPNDHHFPLQILLSLPCFYYPDALSNKMINPDIFREEPYGTNYLCDIF